MVMLKPGNVFSTLARGLLAAMLASLVVAGVAQAVRRVPAWSGRAEAGGNISCTTIVGHFLRNDCFDMYYEVPLAIENAGSKNVTFTINSSSTVSACSAVATGLTGSFVASAAKNVTAPNTFQTLTTDSITVTAGQQFFADCTLTTGARMTALSYAQ